MFGIRSLTEADVRGKKVMEVGSRNVNGSLRPIIESLGPSEYVGVDAESGPGVDRVCRVESIVDMFGKESFDLIVSTELLEHVRHWRQAISNIKGVCARDGAVLVTTRSIGFSYHGFPYDFWRYEPEDLLAIFSDMEIIVLERDHDSTPGVFVKAKKPTYFRENSLSNYQLYSTICGERVHDVDDKQIEKFLSFRQITRQISELSAKIVGRI